MLQEKLTFNVDFLNNSRLGFNWMGFKVCKDRKRGPYKLKSCLTSTLMTRLQTQTRNRLPVGGVCSATCNHHFLKLCALITRYYPGSFGAITLPNCQSLSSLAAKKVLSSFQTLSVALEEDRSTLTCHVSLTWHGGRKWDTASAFLWIWLAVAEVVEVHALYS